MFDLVFDLGPAAFTATARQVLTVVDGHSKTYDISPHTKKFTLRVSKGATIDRVAVRDAAEEDFRASPFRDCDAVVGLVVMSTKNPLRSPTINLNMLSDAAPEASEEPSGEPASPDPTALDGEPSPQSNENGPEGSTTVEPTGNDTPQAAGDQPQTS